MVTKQAAICLMLLLVFPPLAAAESSSINLTPSDNYIAYPGDTVQHHIDVSYTGTAATTLKLDLQSSYLDQITGNGQELVFDNGETNRFIWTLTLPSSVPYGNDVIVVNVIDTSDFSNQSVNVDLMITAPSNIKFGNTQSSTFVVDPGIRTNVATNITNNATLSDDVTFSLETDSSWNWGWTMSEVDGSTSRLELAPDTLDFVRIWVDVPLVLDGAPLANQGPTFRLIGTSGLDKVTIEWSFVLEVTAYRNATIDAVQSDVVVGPDGNTRVDVVVRNTGNTPDTLSMTLGNIAINGQTTNSLDADRISTNGWTVALFNGFEDVQLDPNETRIVEIGIEAPAVTTGTISVDLIVHPTNFPFRTVRETATVNVSWVRDVEHSLVPMDCTYLQPGSTCTGMINVKNIGNFEDAIVVDFVTAPDFVTNITILETAKTLQRYEESVFKAIEFGISDDATAYEQGEVQFELKLNDGNVLERYSIDVVVGPNVAWSFVEGQSEIDSKNIVAFTVQLRNDGNLEDGLLVLLRSSHSTEAGFIPPVGAITQGKTELPRIFELNNLSRGTNLTLRGTAELPSDQEVNGTLTLDIVVRSVFDPETEFVYTIEKEFLGKDWLTTQKEEGYSFSELIEDIGLIVRGWWLVVVGIAVSSVILNKAVRDRMARNEREKLLRHTHEKPEETQEDWLEKFHKSTEDQTTVVESPVVTSDAFTKAFRARSAPSQPALEPLPEPIRDAAAIVLDHHDLAAQRSAMDKIATEIQQKGVAEPHHKNRNLEPSVAVTDRTIRHENANLTTKEKTSGNVPLPKKDTKQDDFDL